MTDSHLYFAYGSNLHVARLRQRVPSARAVAVMRLPDYTLKLQKRGRDGSGKLDIELQPGECVWGVLYELASRDWPALDAAEGSGYRRSRVTVSDRTGTAGIDAFAYMAVPQSIESGLRAFGWYLDYVIAGAIQHSLPVDYLARLRKIPTQADFDTRRVAANRRIMEIENP